MHQRKEELSVEVAVAEGWEESVDDLKDHFTPIQPSSSFSKKLEVDNDELVHLVIEIGNKISEARENADTVSGLKELQRGSQAL